MIMNSKMDDDGLFGDLCFVRDEAEQIIKKIEELMLIDYSDKIADERRVKFSSLFDNEKSIKMLIQTIFGD